MGHNQPHVEHDLVFFFYQIGQVPKIKLADSEKRGVAQFVHKSIQPCPSCDKNKIIEKKTKIQE